MSEIIYITSCTTRESKWPSLLISVRATRYDQLFPYLIAVKPLCNNEL